MDVKFEADPFASPVPVAPRLFAPPLIRIRAREVDEAGHFDAELEVVPMAVATHRPGRLHCRKLTVTRREETSPPVTGEVLRSIPVATLVAGAADHIRIAAADGSLIVRPSIWLSEDDAARLREQGPTDETLGELAVIYRIANVVGQSPTRAVETQFRIPRSTAGRWVALAREKGALGKADGAGRAGG